MNELYSYKECALARLNNSSLPGVGGIDDDAPCSARTLDNPAKS